ncbi:hypothetical protein AVEN_248943-1, partial [Araneus ventricosus]
MEVKVYHFDTVQMVAAQPSFLWTWTNKGHLSLISQRISSPKDEWSPKEKLDLAETPE